MRGRFLSQISADLCYTCGTVVERSYQCQRCGRLDALRQPLSDPLEPLCWYCHGVARVLPQVPTLLLLPSIQGRYVGGERPLRREYVLHEDGRDVVFCSAAQAYRHEMDRHHDPRLARRNLRELGKLGYLPGTRAAEQAAVYDAAAARP